MSTYAVGDIQGCLESLEDLLVKADFRPERDQLWVAGDMINRGPESLPTLRFLCALGNAVKVVLGNHDLHFLAVARGHRDCYKSDTFDALLAAPDCDKLVEWLRKQPLLHHDRSLNHTMVHAGIIPQWNLAEAMAYAREVEEVLQGDQCDAFLASMYGNEPNSWNTELKGTERWRVITNIFTRLRFCTEQGQLNLEVKTGLKDCPEGYAPWFAHPERKTRDDKILFGHWAALEGKTNTENIYALDTGCVWGGKLSMLRLDDEEWFCIDCDL